MNEYSNDEKIKKALESEPVPEELSPESMRAMLDKKAPSKKRSKIKIGTRIAAGAAACAVISGTAVYVAGQGNFLNKHKVNEDSRIYTEEELTVEDPENGEPETPSSASSDITEETAQPGGAFMSGAESYEQIYTLFGEASERAVQNRDYNDYGIMTDGAVEESAMEDNAGGSYSFSTAADSEAGAAEGLGGGDDSSGYYETYDQEEGVREADIVKTDGKNIYYLTNHYDPNDDYSDHAIIRVAETDNGTFTDSKSIEVDSYINTPLGDDYNHNVYVSDMYLYNDMLIVIGTADSWGCITYQSEDNPERLLYEEKSETFVSFFTAGDELQYIDTYYQEGYFSNVRIAPDGYMYLLSNYSTSEYSEINSQEEISRYIPTCGVGGDIDYIEPSCILLPDEEFEDSEWLSYTVIGSLDLNEAGVVAPVQTKALAGYSGTLYCSADNMYTAYGWEDSEITRIAIGAGEITPAASCQIEGYVRNQFSMSEYNGYFRVAVTKDTYEEKYYSYSNDDNNYWWDVFGWVSDSDENGYYVKSFVSRDNRVYVFDLGLNMIGSISGFGENEEVKSVSFNGDMAYVVTYEQTDPLFAIDLSDPSEPAILDELTLPGYSTYMQQWDDGLLLGFGVIESDWEAGLYSGVKLVMFDNSDPTELQQLGEYVIRGYDYDDSTYYIYSSAQWERKALMIAPEKNLIGFPIEREFYTDTGWGREYSYLFFSYEDGEFIQRGGVTVQREDDDWYSDLDPDRALYIGDYLYIMSGDRFYAADIETFSITDEIGF